MRIVEDLVAVWSDRLKRYVIVTVHGREHVGPVAYAFGGGGGGGTEVVPTGPFGPQIPFIMALLGQAANLFAQGPPQFPDFPTVAQPGQDLLASQAGITGAVEGNAGTSQTAIDTALGSALGAGQNPVSSVANPLSGDLQSGLLQLLGGGAQTIGGATNAINTATGGAANAGQGFDPSGAPQLGPAGLDINQTLLNNLGGSGLNSFIDDTIQAATRSLTNNFQQNILPSIGDAAGQAGQAGGTRQGIAEGIAAQQQQQGVADVTAQLFAQGFDRNIGVQQNALSQIGGAQGLQGQFDLGAGGLNEQVRNAILGESLQGAGLSQSGLSTGTAGTGQGISQLLGSLGLLPGLQGSQLSQFGAQNQSGLQQLGLDQANIDAQLQEFFFNQNAPFNALAQFQNFIGGSFGSSVGGNQDNLNFPGLTTDVFGGGGKGAQTPGADVFGGTGKGAGLAAPPALG